MVEKQMQKNAITDYDLQSDFQNVVAFDHFSNNISRNLEKLEKLLFGKWSKATQF